MAKQLSIDDLNRLYSESEQVDQELFAEQRSNVLLVIGDHFNKKGSKFWNRIRDSKELSSEQKLRLSKNHIQKITKSYVNNIIAHAPGVGISPKNAKELQDQKSAEQHHSVWQDFKTRQNFKKRTYELAKDLVELGEAFVKIFWDPNRGQLLGYQPQVDEETGMPVIDPMTGEQLFTDEPIWSGDIVVERLYSFDVLRAPEAKSMDESRYIIYRKMVDIEELKKMIGNDQSRLKFIEESQDETFVVFDSSQGYGRNTKNQCLLKEYYFRPCGQYPRGYYYMATNSGVLFEGELPLGIMPIKYVGFDEAATSARARSIIKQLRPFQAEINRTASKIAETQITLGDDKLLIQDGTKITHGGQVPGIRAVKYTGMTPTVLPGRSGDQYLPYMQAQIEEMYRIANLAEDSIEKPGGQMEAYALLFKSLKDKKQFSMYGEKFEQFLVEICETVLRLCKAYMPEETFIAVAGKNEQVNIAEFKSLDDLGYQIKLEPQVDDVETKMGKQITLTNLLQYVGNQLNKDDIGKIMRLMPYANNEQMFSDFTLDYDNANNDILALDRGEYPKPSFYENHEYMIKRLTHRMKQSDFQFLPPQIQQIYQMKMVEHQQMLEEMNAKISAAKSEWIPTSGYLVVCDLYVSDPDNPTKTRRARVPYDALSWLIKKLEAQGTALDKLEEQSLGVQAQLADMSMAQQQPGMIPPNLGEMNVY